jgi:hypothetical protein
VRRCSFRRWAPLRFCWNKGLFRPASFVIHLFHVFLGNGITN